MVERFNRRRGERLNPMPQNRAAHHRRFLDHAERDAYLLTFLADYNRTRLRCLNYQAPAELIAKLAGHNTFAGVYVAVARAWRVFPRLGNCEEKSGAAARWVPAFPTDQVRGLQAHRTTTPSQTNAAPFPRTLPMVETQRNASAH